MIKKILTYFFVTLGIIFFLLILLSMYVFTADPFNLRPVFTSSDIEVVTTNEDTPQPRSEDDTPEAATDKNPVLNESQEKALETVGIDPANVPTSITPEQEACFIERLGQNRVDEIAAGDSPSIMEILKAKDCVE